MCATGPFVLQARLAQIEFESPTPRKIRSAPLCCESDRVRGLCFRRQRGSLLTLDPLADFLTIDADVLRRLDA